MRKTALNRKNLNGFTLVELLVVIAIIAILASVVVLIVNPIEITRRSRDAARLTDLANLQQAINVAVQEATSTTTDILCVGGITPPATACTGNSTGSRTSDGTGWVKVNLGGQNAVSIPTLPTDPTNSSGTTGYHYTYCSDGTSWEIDAKLESAQYTTAPNDKMTNDGGNDNLLYEVGTDLTLIDDTGTPACSY